MTHDRGGLLGRAEQNVKGEPRQSDRRNGESDQPRRELLHCRRHTVGLPRALLRRYPQPLDALDEDGLGRQELRVITMVKGLIAKIVHYLFEIIRRGLAFFIFHFCLSQSQPVYHCDQLVTFPFSK